MAAKINWRRYGTKLRHYTGIQVQTSPNFPFVLPLVRRVSSGEGVARQCVCELSIMQAKVSETV